MTRDEAALVAGIVQTCSDTLVVRDIAGQLSKNFPEIAWRELFHELDDIDWSFRFGIIPE